MPVISLTDSSSALTELFKTSNIIEVFTRDTGSNVQFYAKGAVSQTAAVTLNPTQIQGLAPNIIAVSDVSANLNGVGITAVLTYSGSAVVYTVGETLLINGVGAGTVSANSGSTVTVTGFTGNIVGTPILKGNSSGVFATYASATYTYKIAATTRYINAERCYVVGNAGVGAVNLIHYYNQDNSVFENIYVSNTQAALATLINTVNSPVFAKATVTQITSIATGVIANAPAGVVTTVSSTLAADASAEFTVTNSFVGTASVVIANIVDYAGTDSTNGIPVVKVDTIGTGSFKIVLSNAHATNALSGILKIGFIVV